MSTATQFERIRPPNHSDLFKCDLHKSRKISYAFILPILPIEVTKHFKNLHFILKLAFVKWTRRPTMSSPCVSLVHNFRMFALSAATVLIILQHSLGKMKSAPFDDRLSHASKHSRFLSRKHPLPLTKAGFHSCLYHICRRYKCFR